MSFARGRRVRRSVSRSGNVRRKSGTDYYCYSSGRTRFHVFYTTTWRGAGRTSEQWKCTRVGVGGNAGTDSAAVENRAAAGNRLGPRGRRARRRRASHRPNPYSARSPPVHPVLLLWVLSLYVGKHKYPVLAGPAVLPPNPFVTVRLNIIENTFFSRRQRQGFGGF